MEQKADIYWAVEMKYQQIFAQIATIRNEIRLNDGETMTV